MNRLTECSLGHPVALLAVLGIVTIVFGYGVLRLELRIDGAALYPVSAVVEATELDRLRFQDPRQLVLLVGSQPSGPLVESPEGFRFVSDLHQKLSMAPEVHAEGLRSLAGLVRLEEGSGGFAVRGYLNSVPDEREAFASTVATLRALALTDGLLLSTDGRLAAIYVPLTTGNPVRQLESLSGRLEGFLQNRQFETTWRKPGNTLVRNH